MATIYDQAGLGTDAAYGVRQAARRIDAAYRRMRHAAANVPAPLTAPDLPTREQVVLEDIAHPRYSAYGGKQADREAMRGVFLRLTHSEYVLATSYRYTTWGDGELVRTLTPAQMLLVQRAAEAFAAEAEALDEQFERECAELPEQLLASEDEAIRELARTAAEVVAAHQAEEAARTAREAEKQAAEAAYQAERETWIGEHGSERLQRLAAEGIEHEAVYRDERLAAERPGWRWERQVPGSDHEPRNAPSEALVLLDEARQADPEAVLRYWTVPHEHCGADGEVECEASEPHAHCGDDGCPQFDWRGYVALAELLGQDIVYGGPLA